MELWSDWRSDPDSTLNEVGSLPTTVKAVNSPTLKKAKPHPEPGSKLAGGTGYRQVQTGGKNIIKDLDKMYILKKLGHYDSSRKDKVK